MKHRILTCLLALTGSLLTLGASPATAADPDPHFEQPVVGECHYYNKATSELRSDVSPVVGCASRHTAIVIRTFLIPDNLDWPLTQAQLLAQVRPKCEPALARAVGRSRLQRALLGYVWVFFEPTKAQKDAGARWLRCDAVLWGGKTHLTALPYSRLPLSRTATPMVIRKCIEGRTWYYTACSRRHAYRATGSFNVRPGAYPGAARMRRIAIRNCSPRVTSRTFYWVAPTRSQWQRNWRVVVCYTKTHS